MTTEQPELISIRGLRARFGIARTQAYDLLKTKKITARKNGRSTLIEVASVRAYINSLPPYRA